MDHQDIPSDKKQFPCAHCGGRIIVPRDLPPTTAPCPYCGVIITSPAGDGPSSAAPPPAPVAAAPQVMYSPPAEPPPVPRPVVSATPVYAAPPPPAAVAPVQAAPQAAVEPVPQRVEKTPAKVKPQPATRTGAFPILLTALLLLGGGALTYFVTKEMNREIPAPSVTQPASLTALEPGYIRIGWQKEATRLLTDFLAADKAAEKLPFILNAETLAPRVMDFYGTDIIDDSDTPAAAFSVYELSEEDRKRGLFMMTYDQPPQFDMREFFRPLATLEVQYGIDEADLLLSTVARAGNFAMEPLRVHAFFKMTSAGLKLDWEIYAQTRYRTFRSFTEQPEPERSGVFRVFVVEDVPDKSHAVAGMRTYRLSDPAHTEDTARVTVKEDSDIGRSLSQLNWLGTKDGNPLTRTATVELAWSGNPGPAQLQLQRFICWEFLGLGGQEGSASTPAK
jgi:cell division septation protein DedD